VEGKGAVTGIKLRSGVLEQNTGYPSLQTDLVGEPVLLHGFKEHASQPIFRSWWFKTTATPFSALREAVM
jgi:hypothetical protein